MKKYIQKVGKKINTKTLLIPLIGFLTVWGINQYIRAIKISSQDIGEMKSLIESSPRKEYVIQGGDSLDLLRNRFFPIENNEFKGLDSKIFGHNPERFYGEGYKGLTADNTWAEIVRKENNLPLRDCFFKGTYYVEEGRKLNVPARIK